MHSSEDRQTAIPGAIHSFKGGITRVMDRFLDVVSTDHKRDTSERILRIKPNLLGNHVSMLADIQRGIDSEVKDQITWLERDFAAGNVLQKILPLVPHMQVDVYRQWTREHEEEIRKFIQREINSHNFFFKNWGSEMNTVYARWLYATTVGSLHSQTRTKSDAVLEWARPLARQVLSEGISHTMEKGRVDEGWLSLLGGSVLTGKITDDVLSQELQKYVDNPPVRQ